MGPGQDRVEQVIEIQISACFHQHVIYKIKSTGETPGAFLLKLNFVEIL